MGFFDKLKKGLFKTKDAIVGKIDSIFKHFTKVDEDLFDELEELLISADVGVVTTEEVLDELRETVKENKIKEPEAVKEELYAILRRLIGEHEPLKLDTTPSVILVIGVNGVGKTTSIGKCPPSLSHKGKGSSLRRLIPSVRRRQSSFPYGASAQAWISSSRRRVLTLLRLCLTQ